MSTDYTEVPNLTDGDTVTADNLDTYLGNNFKAVFESLSAGELVRLNSGGKFLEAAGHFITDRQGGSATDWNVPGSTDYAASSPKMQCGSFILTFAAETNKTITVTYPDAYNYKPLVILGDMYTLTNAGFPWSGKIYSLSNTSFAYSFTFSSAVTGDIHIHWLAVGN